MDNTKELNGDRAAEAAYNLKRDYMKTPDAISNETTRVRELQAYGTIVRMAIALDNKVCGASVDNLNQLLADTMTLRDLYKKHHWQVSGPTFYQLHLLFDKHFQEQSELVDLLAERIQTLGGVTIAMAHDVAETSLIPRMSRSVEDVPSQMAHLLHAHEIVLMESRTMARQAAEKDDQGTNDILVSDVIRTNELQVWFVSKHVVGATRTNREN